MSDLIFHAGAGCYDLYGTLSKRTSLEEDVAETFTRTGTAYYVDRAGVLKLAEANALRTEWTGSDFSTPTLLLEDARTNLALRSEELDNGSWASGGSLATVTANDRAAPDGTTTADKVDDTGASLERRTQTITVADDSETHVLTGYFRADTSSIVCLDLSYVVGTGVGYGVVVDLSDGTAIAATGGLLSTATAPSSFGVTALGDGWYRAEVAGANNGTGNTSVSLLVYPAWNTSKIATPSNAATGAVHAWGVQLEKADFASSYIKTTTVAVTRNAETCSFPFVAPPQEMTVYLRFVESGTVLLATDTTRVFQIGTTAFADPRFFVDVNGNKYRVAHDNSSIIAIVTLAAAPSINDSVEIRAVLAANGGVVAGQSIAGAGETTATDTTPAALGDTWAGAFLYINSSGSTNRGFSRFKSIKIARGTKTLAEMRALGV